MTLIALTLNHAHPYIIGDIFVTTTEDGHGYPENFLIPTFIDSTKTILKDAIHKPAGLFQKVYVINRKLCVAMAGRLDQMTSFLRALKANFENQFASEMDLANFCDCYPKDKSDMLSYILLVDVSEKRIEFRYMTKGKYEACDHVNFDKIYAMGTGAEHFIKIASTEATVKHQLNNAETLQAWDENQLYTHELNLGITSFFIGQEMVDAGTLKNAWGGGFELIGHYGPHDGFCKIGNRVLVIMSCEFDHVKQIFVNERMVTIMKYHYNESAFLIESLGNGKSIKYLVKDLLKDHNAQDQIRFSMPSYLDCQIEFLYLVRISAEVFANSSCFVLFPRQTKELKFKEYGTESIPCLDESATRQMALNLRDKIASGKLV